MVDILFADLMLARSAAHILGIKHPLIASEFVGSITRTGCKDGLQKVRAPQVEQAGIPTAGRKSAVLCFMPCAMQRRATLLV